VHRPNRAARIIAERITGATLAEIAAEHGVTRQRVDHIVRRYASASERAAIRRAVERRRSAAERERSVAEAAERARECAEAREDGRICPICGACVVGRGRRTCGGECAERWEVVRRVLDEDSHEAWRRANARIVLRDPERHPRSVVEHARAVLSDDPPPPNRRFVRPGSRVAQVLAEIGR
jgi:hypothetical protein